MTIDRSAEMETFEEYKKTLRLVCEPGEPAILNWTVPLDAPDTLYYQVTKKMINLKIHNFINLFIFNISVLYTQKFGMENYRRRQRSSYS